MADLVAVTDIYSVRETEEARRAVHASHLVERIRIEGGSATYVGDLDHAADFLQANLKKGDVLLTVGAGDVNRILKKIA